MITDKTKWDDVGYYAEHFDDIMYDKITEGIDLTEEELRELRYSRCAEIEGDKSRWSVYTQSIVKLRDKYFSIDWDQGLTEIQEDEFCNQPYEVKKVEKMIPVAEWLPVDQNS